MFHCRRVRSASGFMHPIKQLLNLACSFGSQREYLWQKHDSPRMAPIDQQKETRDNRNKQQPRRIRKPLQITLSDEAITILKSTGYPASCVIEKLILNAYLETHPICLQLGISRCACCNVNTRSLPCGGHSAPQAKNKSQSLCRSTNANGERTPAESAAPARDTQRRMGAAQRSLESVAE